jgi:Lipase
VNWVNGAKGPNYLRAVANAELVARQVSRLIVEMIAIGASPRDIHIIGFSLGAQVAGITGAAIQREGFKIGRITGIFFQNISQNLLIQFSRLLKIIESN